MTTSITLGEAEIEKARIAYSNLRGIHLNPGDALASRMIALYAMDALKQTLGDALFADIDAEAPEMPDTPFF